MSSIMVLAIWLPANSTGAIIGFTIPFGFFSGAYISLIAALVVQISPLSEIGLRTGWVYFLASIGGLITGPIAGRILGTSSGWVGAKVMSGVLCLTGSTFVLGVRIKVAGWKLNAIF